MNLTEAKQFVSDKVADLFDLESLLEMVVDCHNNGDLMVFKQQHGDIFMRITELGEIKIDRSHIEFSTISFKFKSITMSPPDISFVKVTTQNGEAELNLKELRCLSKVDDESQVKEIAKDVFNKLIDQI